MPTPAVLVITDPLGTAHIRLADDGEPEYVICQIAEWWRARRAAGDRPDIGVWLASTPLPGTVAFAHEAARGAHWCYSLHLPAPDSPDYPGDGPALRATFTGRDLHNRFERTIRGEWHLLAYTEDGPFTDPPDGADARSLLAAAARYRDTTAPPYAPPGNRPRRPNRLPPPPPHPRPRPAVVA